MRLRIVTRRRRDGSSVGGYLGFSFAVHIAALLAVAFMPSFKKAGPLIDQAAVFVELAPAASPTPAASIPAPPPPVEKEPEPIVEPEPEGASVSDDVVLNEKKPEKEPEDKPKPPPKKDPEPVRTPPVTNPSAGTPVNHGGAPEGASIEALAGGDPQFDWYRSSVTAALYSAWRAPILNGLQETLQVAVAFEIQRDGTVLGVRIEERSGVSTLDRSALRAVADASPLPGLPSAWREQSLAARFVFKLHPEDF